MRHQAMTRPYLEISTIKPNSLHIPIHGVNTHYFTDLKKQNIVVHCLYKNRLTLFVKHV